MKNKREVERQGHKENNRAVRELLHILRRNTPEFAFMVMAYAMQLESAISEKIANKTLQG